MSSRSSSILQKVAQDRTRGDFQKALKRLRDAIQKDPSDVDLFMEAIEVALEASESIDAVDLFKRAYQRFPNHANDLWDSTLEKLRTYNDPILASFLFEFAIKKRELETGLETLSTLRDHTVNDLLKRARTKKQTLTSAMSGSAGFRNEMTVNALSEAILCLKTKRYQEAVRLFLRVLDDKPVEHGPLKKRRDYLRSRLLPPRRRAVFTRAPQSGHRCHAGTRSRGRSDLAPGRAAIAPDYAR